MDNIIIAVHGGASEHSTFIQTHQQEIREVLAQSINLGYELLEQGKSALDAVEKAVRLLEDSPLFNAGRGSALNCKGEVEMDASIMDGRTLDAGAVSMVRRVKNPITLARLVMEKTKHVLLSGYGALEWAVSEEVDLEEEEYFKVAERLAELNSLTHKHGTVGAVALDKKGNLAAATSTGGTCNSLPGRIGDSCIIGAGCYANNQTCAVSATGEGEFIIKKVTAHAISCMMEKNIPLQEACKHVIFNTPPKGGEMGVISVNAKGELGIAFNTQIMKRGWKNSSGAFEVHI